MLFLARKAAGGGRRIDSVKRLLALAAVLVLPATPAHAAPTTYAEPAYNSTDIMLRAERFVETRYAKYQPWVIGSVCEFEPTLEGYCDFRFNTRIRGCWVRIKVSPYSSGLGLPRVCRKRRWREPAVDPDDIENGIDVTAGPTG